MSDLSDELSNDAEINPCGHARHWIAYRDPTDRRSSLYCVFCELERLQKRASKEVDEFNAGYDCASNGGSIDDEPAEGISEDHWKIGFKAGSFDRQTR